MGNHCIDCKFCGQDQRIVGDSCCVKYIKQEKDKRDAVEAQEKAEDEVLARYGLSAWYNRNLHASDVVAFIKANEGNLKPNLGIAKCDE